MKNRTEDTLCLVGGALLGAAAMYLLDPETGERRRRRLAAAAENAYENARESIGEGWQRLAERTGDWSESASGYTQGLAEKAGDIASGLAAGAGGYLSSGKKSADEASHRAGKWGSSLMGRAHEAYERARGAVSDYGHSGRRLFGRAGDTGEVISARAKRLGRRAGKAGSSIRAIFTGEEEREGFGAFGITSTALTCCAVGAGLMYFMDPERGRYRRNWVADKATHFARTTGRSMRATGRNLANRARGTAYEAAEKARNMTGYEGQVGSEQLVNRVRSGMGHVISNPSQVQIMADANGIVTLTGIIPASESEVLCATVRGIPGVIEVINRLDTSPPANPAPRSRGNPATSQRS
jgi:gas vesicle protein